MPEACNETPCSNDLSPFNLFNVFDIFQGQMFLRYFHIVRFNLEALNLLKIYIFIVWHLLNTELIKHCVALCKLLNIQNIKTEFEHFVL